MNQRRRTPSRRKNRHEQRSSLIRQGLAGRTLLAEQLESRMLLAGDVNFHNTFYPQDVDQNLRVTPRDALVIINALNAGGPRDFAAASGDVEAAAPVEGESTSTFMYDVNNDSRLSPSDALRVINFLNAQEGEHGQVMEFRIVLLQPGTSNPLPATITKGTDFEIGVIVQDIRGPDQPGTEGDRGVFSAMLDVNLLTKALAQVEIEEVQRIKITGNPTGGSFTLSFNDGTTTTTTQAIQYLPLTESRVAIANRIRAALESRSNIGTGNVEVIPSLSDPQAFDVRFQGTLGDKNFALMTGNAGSLTGGTNPAIQITTVVDGVYSSEAFRQALRRYQVVAGQLIADYNQVVTGSDAISPDRIDDVGGVHTDFLTGHFPDGTEADPRLLFRVRMNSLDAGMFSVAGSVDAISGENLLYSVLDPAHSDPLSASEISIVNPAALTIIEPFSAVADSFTFNEDPGTQSLNVTGNDTANSTTTGAPTGALPSNVVIISTSTPSLGGTVSINTGGKTLNYTPALNASGTETFTYTLRNPTTGVTDTATVTITLNAVNDAPVNVLPAPRTVAEDGTLTLAGNLSITDVDAGTANVQTTLTVNSGTLTLSTTSGISFIAGADNSATMTIQGTLASINAALNGMQYHPNADFNGSDPLQINTTDLGASGSGGSKSDVDSLQITVTAVNDAPAVAVPGAQSAVETVPEVLDAITVSDVDFGATTPTNMRVTVAVDGSGTFSLASTTGLSFTAGDGTDDNAMTFTGNLTNINAALAGIVYTAALGDAAAARTLTVTADDQGSVGGGALSDQQTVTINVVPLDRPFARDDAFTVNEDSTAGDAPNPLPVLGNDFFDAGHVLEIIDFTQPAHGTVIDNGDGTLSYVPNPDFFGTDTFRYTINQTPDPKAPGDIDEDQMATVTITVTNTPDNPVAVADVASTNEDTAVDIAVLANDSDVDLGVPPASQTPTATTHTVVIVDQPSHGAVSVNADGTVRYTPAANYFGPDSFTYKLRDASSLESGVVAVDITVNAVNDAPVSGNDSYSTNEDITLDIPAPGVLGNDTDVDGPAVTVSSVTQQPTKGNLTLNSDGSFTYVPNANANGTDTFKYRATDGSLTSNEATVTITINAVNDAPVAVDDTYTATEDTPRNVITFATGLIGNDTDVDNAQNTLTIAAFTQPANGSVTVNSDGTFSYTPDQDFTGTDTFTYRVKDPGNAESNTATVTIIVQEVNDPSTANPDSYSVDEDNVLTVSDPALGVLFNDTDPDTAAALLKAVNASDPAHGTVTLNQNGTFTYTPDSNYFGPDSFTYQVDDGQNLSTAATVSITVVSVNDNPVVADDTFTAIKHNPPTQVFPNQQILVLANDQVNDPDPGETLTIVSVTQPTVAGGTVTISGDGKSVLYTPAEGYEGPDSFTYTVEDNGTNPNNLQSTTTVNITVVNFIPTDISGTVWTDTDNDGVIDPNERRLAGVEVRIQGTSFRGAAVDQTVETNVDGFYIFLDVEPGDYTVTETQPLYLRDGKDDFNTAINGFDTAIPIVTGEFNDHFTLSIPLLSTDDPSKSIGGNNFGEMGFDTAYINIAELLASTTNNGLIFAIGAGGQQLWQTKLDGWDGMLSCSVVLNSNNSLTLTVVDGNGPRSQTISQSGNPRFRIIGQNGADGYLIRIEGTASDFGWSLAAAQPQAEGEADYARDVDALMNAIGNA